MFVSTRCDHPSILIAHDPHLQGHGITLINIDVTRRKARTSLKVLILFLGNPRVVGQPKE